ncbi:phosphoribosyltransferase [Actinokineospora globicatena]|uniref:Phosphoribosyltransferase n=1 Tax=Actinokineospora globicatena TaxID=103729 RepID=A0A9W6QS16_9PSEU|nr:phosphoribosyltransferase family protein [Actinokineospora globicatena]MCP2304914.1 putative phosphoribosyl transferase [Actinokineospora globicatena]GLW77704.1 phosphoribosyltransferase [Actinokineospora globicatena]GLW85627.1 phosphoribosyltransferase [Actinokineospora globicatena]GLW95085.1 phosphoribosyltransferase [Actinokineospora globicatena]
MHYTDRVHAGQVLGARLLYLRDDDPVILGLPRGGVPVAAVVAELLAAELDVVLVGKVGAPGAAELAVGAVGEGRHGTEWVEVRADPVLALLELSWSDVADTVARVKADLTDRSHRLRGGVRPHSLDGRTVVVVDDGVATGSTVEAAVRVVRGLGAQRVVLAVPVAPANVVDRLTEIADDVICPLAPDDLTAVGQWYQDFTQVGDAEVRELLAR